MGELKTLDSGVIFRNPLPGHRAINAIYPFILPLDGEYLCVLRIGQALYSPDGMLDFWLAGRPILGTARSRMRP